SYAGNSHPRGDAPFAIRLPKPAEDLGLSRGDELPARREKKLRRALGLELRALRRRPSRGALVRGPGGGGAIGADRGGQDRLHARDAPVSRSRAPPRVRARRNSRAARARGPTGSQYSGGRVPKAAPAGARGNAAIHAG